MNLYMLVLYVQRIQMSSFKVLLGEPSLTEIEFGAFLA